ncbi:MAG: hypothetical protein LBL04_11290 [Bacteroidales bacterium]|jgi:hypothetical protein|nr:hypothetical protein [Bacteroidales bacterium]
MAYNRENILTRVVDIQNITWEHTGRGVTQEWVYNNVVFPKYVISKATYYAYLAMPAKRELQLLREKKQRQREADDRQLKLF